MSPRIASPMHPSQGGGRGGRGGGMGRGRGRGMVGRDRDLIGQTIKIEDIRFEFQFWHSN